MNRLAEETSPYLRQHADNPVDWYPWGDEAFAQAKAEDKPVLLSVGYSACHWCHVMAHESFEDPDVAAVMNDLFVNVKVDREQRPDVDAVYMEATQAMTGQGGWPMTVFMTPEGEPFFCGTYFPNPPQQGQPGFLDVCRAIHDAWRNRRDDLTEQAVRVTEHLRASSLGHARDRDNAELPNADVVTAGVTQLLHQHDPEWGGFGNAPKFPQTMSLDLLMRAHLGTREEDTLGPVLTTLDAMASGGIYDHLGGGFARYSVDRHWLVPHFEKMLYDQALLARAYLHAWLLTGQPRFRQVLEETVGYVLRDLRHPAGGFWSAEDADSEGVEGKFYVWTPDQMRAALGIDAEPAMEHWGVAAEGNFEGATILNRLHARGDLVRPELIEDARRRLLDVRDQRVRPGLDDKVLTEWNGLMLSTLAEAAAATGNQFWLEEAVANAELLLSALRRPNGRWSRAWQGDREAAGAPPGDQVQEAGGRAGVLAFAADHAALVDAFTRLAEATGEARWIGHARHAADALLHLFWDNDQDGFFTTGHDAEHLVARQKDLLDNATPGANSQAAVALLRLGALTGDIRYRTHAERVLSLLGPVAGQHPTAFANLLAAVDMLAHGITEIVIPGRGPAARELVAVVHQRWLPNAVLAWGEPYDSPLWENRADAEGYAFICRDFTCELPASDPAELAGQLAR